MNSGESNISLVEAICVCDREQARLDAAIVDHVYALYHEQKGRTGECPHTSVTEELRLARNVSRGQSIDTVKTAIFLRERMPGLVRCMRAGLVGLVHASKVRKAFGSLPGDLVDLVDTRIVERLRGKGRPRDWTGYLRRLADGLEPEAKAIRIAAARTARRVSFRDRANGTGNLSARLPSEDLAACETRVEAITRSLRRAGDPRTLDQLRADVVTDLLTGHDRHTGVQAVVNVHVPLGVALEISDEHCRVNGYGEIPAHTAQAMLADPRNAVRKILTDPDTGVIRGLGRHCYRPSARQRDYVRLRDQRCRAHGCCRPITEIDHIQEHASNDNTSPDNLQGLCRLDHRMKSVPGWHHALNHRTGELEITTPSGHTYRN
ncbi:HNH endonuclease signature motif containing protein [Sciscionella marina]|uniref:HNH endonuclease signature motif containing protein n=1 Tax=Sciscionella marina TaxID=508770 RepID=UPI0003A63BA8|nr:HNH endonuclease signature motif containing protein [Sciscionella marina]